MQLRQFCIKVSALVVLLFAGANAVNAQIYGKMNILYACVGIINPQVEFRLSEHSSLQTELTVSPYKKVLGEHHFLFGIFTNEYRYFIGDKAKGLYVGADAGLYIFDMSKPEFGHGRISLQNRYCKGYGIVLGAVIGWEYEFRERWLLDVYAGFGYFASWYNGYDFDGTLQLHPHGHEWDPFNGSAEWLPTKVGVSIGYKLFDPQKRKKQTVL